MTSQPAESGRKRGINDGRVCVRTVAQLVPNLSSIEGKVEIQFCPVTCQHCRQRKCGVVTYAKIGKENYSPLHPNIHICGECDRLP